MVTIAGKSAVIVLHFPQAKHQPFLLLRNIKTPAVRRPHEYNYALENQRMVLCFPTLFKGSLSGLLHLHELDLSNNSLQFIQHGVLEDLYFLYTLKLGGNPWMCDYRWVLHLKGLFFCFKVVVFFKLIQTLNCLICFLHIASSQHPLHGVLAASAPVGEALWPGVSLPSWAHRGESGGLRPVLQQRVSEGQEARTRGRRPNGSWAVGHGDGGAGRSWGAGAQPLESAAEIPDLQALLTSMNISPQL